MVHPTRLLVVLSTFFLAPPVGAEDKPPATPADARRAALVRAGYTPVPLALDAPSRLYFHVDGAVGPEKVKFFLDSGTDTLLDLELAKRLKLELGKEAESVGLVGGGSVGREVLAPGLTIGPYDTRKDWPNVAALAADLSGRPGVSGVLGKNVLDEWAAVVDYPARTLYLRPPLATAWPKLAGTWVVTSWQEDGASRRIDPAAPPTFTFADRRLKLADGGTTREYAVGLTPDQDGADMVRLFDPTQEGKPDSVTLAGGLVKVAGGRMTACLALDAKKVREPPAEFAAPKGSGLVLLELKHSAPNAAARKPADPLRALLVKDGYTAVPMDRLRDGTRVVAARVGRHDLRLMVDTGSNVSAFDAAGLDKWGAERTGGVEASGFGGKAKAEQVSLRGLQIGGYDTRRSWAAVYGVGLDLAGVNTALAGQKLPPLQGVLGNLDLLNGAAVVDYGTDTLYLRPVKEVVGPRLEGKWVAVAWESDGERGRYNPGDAAIEFQGGQIRFTNSGMTVEWGFHLQDLGDRYRIGLFGPKADDLADGFRYTNGGLLRLAGDTLTLVIRRDGGPRVVRMPTEFAAPKGSGLGLVEFKRAK